MNLIKKILEFFKGKKQETVQENIEIEQEVFIKKTEPVEIIPQKVKKVKRTVKAKARKKANIKKRTTCGKKPQTNRRNNKRR